MNQVSEAIARYHKLIESEPYIDLAWAQALQERMKAEKLGSRPISPVLRPHFITEPPIRGADQGCRVAAVRDRAGGAVGARDAGALGADATVAGRADAGAVDPGYSFFSVTGLLDTNLNNGSMHFVSHHADAPAGVVFGEALADLYYEAPPVKEFRKKYKLTKLGGTKYLLQAMLKAYKDFGGKQKKPQHRHRGIPPAVPAGGHQRKCTAGRVFHPGRFPTEIVSPDQLEYRNGVLRRGEFTIDIVLSPHQTAGVSGPLRFEPSAGARLQGSRGVHGE